MTKKIKINYKIDDQMNIDIDPTNYKVLLQCLDAEDMKRFENYTQSYLAKVDNLANLKSKKITSGKLEFILEDSYIIDWDDLSK